jgi:nicotinate-nucleotide adenylyltransferase
VYIKEKYPKDEFALIMGGDNLENFHKWKNYQSILDAHDIFVYPRPNTKGSQFDEHPTVHLTQAPLMDISSVFIRKCIVEKKKVNYFLPNKVWQYVDEMNFYK